ncbi:MAG: Wzz/FepE/Etk N-terminal domain-containing protein [Thermocrinis sp.]|jgi:capsular polysaccharide biosynthesis protein|uniref:Wzz/FepE/Etk N-terminal domain-containing protein n=1 Tax=Thermocrinis sp. TaxID=2024383 RepID=UPI003BFD018E
MEQDKTYNDEIDLFELLQKLYERRWIIIGITAFTTALAILVSVLMPKAYKAEAVVEVQTILQTIQGSKIIIQTIQGSKTIIMQDPKIIDIPEIQEGIKVYKDDTLRDILKKVKVSPIRNSQNMAKMEVEGISPQIAKENLEKGLEIINKRLFPQKIEELKRKYETRLNFINQAILNVNSGKYVIFDLSKMVDLLTEKEQIQKWLQDPKFVILVSDIQTSSEPVRPKPLLYTSIGFVAGIFLGIFVALVLEAIKMSISHPEG